MNYVCPSIRKSVSFFLVIIVLNLLSIADLRAQPNKSYWQQWESGRYVTAPVRYALPVAYTGYTLNVAALKQALSLCPMEFTPTAMKSNVTIQLPSPKGGFETFRMVESRVMHPDLAAVFPQIKTYSGQGISDPSAIVKVSISPVGFHGMILSREGSVFIDPWDIKNSSDYIVYKRSDFRPYAPFNCESDENYKDKSRSFIQMANGSTNKTHGTQLRNYRLALSCTGEYAAYYGGTTAGALAGMVASMNRVNGVYESEVAVRMTLVPNDTLLIYLNGATDPFSNGNGSAMLGENITTCNTVIGTSNYDIGHVFSTGGGGVAYLGVPCTANKAGGVTGSGSPVGDAFDIDYVAHEMGHQFGGSHTFNAGTGSCSGNRTATAAFEPGSGITIMAYAGICTATNDLAPNSIAYFHTYSFDQITSYITTGSGGTCPTTTATGNTPPLVTPAGLNYTIPFLTPFTLSATGSDANGDALTYSWEEYDLGASGNWNAPVGDAPVFRPFPPVSSGSRTFPKLSDILTNTTTIGELLPSYARTLKFRVTVRDNRAGGGGVMHPDDTVRVNVVNTGTAFSVVAPNTAQSWFTLQPATVTWNVSSTHLAPINTANVNILLSLDGGITFPIALATATPNDGSEVITVPANLTTQARVKVEAVGNIFFDISDANFTIAASSPLLSVLTTNSISPLSFCAGQAVSISFTGNGPANAGNTYTAQLSSNTGSFTAPVAIGSLVSTSSSGTISCTLPAGTLQGSAYRIRVVASNPAVSGGNNGSNLTINTTVGSTGTVSGPATVCQSQTGVIFSVPATTNATTYAWTLPTGFSITAGAGTNSITVSTSAVAVSGSITVTPSNSCSTGGSSLPFAVTVNPLPAAAGVISGTASLCPGQASGVTYSVPVIANASGYNWTLPAGASIVSGANTNAISVLFGTVAASGTISVQGTNACGMGTASSFTVTILPAPQVPVIVVNGNDTACSPGGVNLSFTPQNGVSYKWRKNGIDIPGATGTSLVALSGGSYDVVASVIPIGSQLLTSTVQVPIPDNSCAGAVSVINVSNYNFPVRSSGIYIKMNITHTYLGDLDIYLESPSGQRLGISDQTGNANNSGDNFTNTVLADSGAAKIPTSGAPYTNLYKPWSPVFTVTGCSAFTTGLTTFAGFGGGYINPNGDWKLAVYDRFATDTGRVVSWSIFFPYMSSSCTVQSLPVNVTVLPSPALTGFSPQSGVAGNTVTITGSGFTTASAVTFNGIAAAFTISSNTQILATVPPGVSSGPIAVTTVCGTLLSSANFIVNANITLNITALVEGLHTNNASMAGVLSPSQSDTITLVLRSPVSPFAQAYTGTAIMNLQGQASLSIPAALSGNTYYIIIKHRNALETWSKVPVLFGTTTSYNFKQ